MIDKIKNILNEVDAKIYLYGSRVKGKETKYSDWDLLILVNIKELSFEKEIEIMNILYELEIETGEIISPMIYSSNDWNINNERINPKFFQDTSLEMRLV